MQTIKIDLKKILSGLLILGTLFSACKKNTPEESEQSTAKIENVELGTGNNKKALRGRDFHFNADVLALTKISDVRIKIAQKQNETYTAKWDWGTSMGSI